MGALTTENELLWPPFHGPSDLAEVERVPLSERGLPASTYELVRRAAEADDEDFGPPSSPSVVSELIRTASLHVQLHQRAAGSGKLIVKFADPASRDALVAAITRIAKSDAGTEESPSGTTD